MRIAGLILLLLFLVTGCQQTSSTSQASQTRPWTIEELGKVFDTTELGELTVAEDGSHLILAGRPIPTDMGDYLRLTAGNTINLLRFSDELLAAISDEARHFVTFASGDELKEMLASYGLTPMDVHKLWVQDEVRSEITLDAVYEVAAMLDHGIETASNEPRRGVILLKALGLSQNEEGRANE
jgi:hypothetical protein